MTIGSEWFSRKGGLSTFNRLLSIYLAEAGHKVFCYVASFNEEEQKAANSNGVILLKPKPTANLSETERLLNCPVLPNGLTPEILIGHGLITGQFLRPLKEGFFRDAKSILFIHTSPSETEFYKPEKLVESVSASAEDKERKQKELIKYADLIACVGPHLFFETASLLAGITPQPNLFQFDPGLPRTPKIEDFVIINPVPEALIMGRLEDFELKGVDIGVRAMHHVYNRWDKLVNGYQIKPKLILRGSPVGSDTKLIQKLKEIEESNLRIQPKNYSPEIDVITEDIRRAAIVLMPSRVEGFGLIALEAISYGRPIVISEQSGLAILLKRISPNEAARFILPVSEKSISDWSDLIYKILSEREDTSIALQELVKNYAASITWEDSIRRLLDVLYINESQYDDTRNISKLRDQIEPQRDLSRGFLKLESNMVDELNQSSMTSQNNNSDSIHSLVRSFLILSDLQKISIAKKLDAFNENFKSLPSVERDKEILKRINDKKLLSELWDEINQLAAFSNNNNPFKKIKE
jgi:glycosyltransferase involved in cell wall biosynthesis